MTERKDLISFLRSLRAIRYFRPQPVSAEAVDDILEVARWSGSANNRQPWQFIVVRDPDTLQALAALSPTAHHVAGAALAVVLVMAGQDDQTETFDEGRLSERIMLAAKAYGIGSSIGWLGDTAARDQAKQLLGIPAEHTVRTIISLGYPEPHGPRRQPRTGRPRKPLSELLHEEHWQNR